MRDQEQKCPHCEMPVAFNENGATWYRHHQAMECVEEIKRVRDTFRNAQKKVQTDHEQLTEKYEDALRMIVDLKEKVPCPPTTDAPNAESAATASSEAVDPAPIQNNLCADIARITTILHQTSAPSA